MKLRFLVFAVAAALFVLYAAFAELNGARGFNYRIYQYFGGLALDGANPYQPPPVALDSVDHRQPHYLDFTGLSLALYTGAVWLDRTTGIDGFYVLSLAWFLAFLGLLWMAERRGGVTPSQTNAALALAVLTPGLVLPLLVNTFEDKVGFLVVSATGLLVAAKRYDLAAAASGFFTGLIGFPAAFLPVILFAAWNDSTDRTRVTARLLAIFTVVALIALAPFFPDSLLGWERRAILEAAPPRWYSLWNLLPGYVPGMNKAILAAAVAGILLATWRRAMTPALAIFLITVVATAVSSNPGIQRVTPLVVVAGLFLSGREERRVYLGAALMYLWGATLFASLPYPSGFYLRIFGPAFMFAPLFLFVALKLRESVILRRLPTALFTLETFYRFRSSRSGPRDFDSAG